MKATATKNASIVSVGTYLPEQRVSSESLFEEFNSDTKYDYPTNWMSEKMGIIERRMAPANAKPSDLAIPAAREAIESCDNYTIDNIDMVIWAGIERDQPEPATAHRINHELGLNASHVFDVANACYGFMQAMEIATQYIKSGTVEYALIVTGEVPTKVALAALEKLKSGISTNEASNIIGALSVGDAGGAIVLGASYGYDAAGFQLFNTTTDSSHINKCIYSKQKDGAYAGQMQMGRITFEIVEKHRKLISNTLERLGWDEFDWVLTHQMGKRPFEKLSMMQGSSPEKMVKTYDLLGNITSATFALGYQKLLQNDKVQHGDKIGGCFAGSGLAIGQVGYRC